MKRFLAFSGCLLMLAPLTAQTMENAWKEAARIEETIKPPVFPNRDYNVVDYGAVPDSTKLSSEAINLAIVECSVNGGGRVIVPAGTYLTGPIRLKSHVNLYLEKGARLLFSSRKELYLPPVQTRWEGMDCYNYQPLVYAYGESNFAITGQGVIDGNASNENWWNLCGSKEYGWKPGQLSQNFSGRVRLLQASEGQLPMEKRIMGTEDALRPQLVNFVRCNNVLMEGVTLLNSPFWVIHPLLSENLTFRGLTIKNNGPNGDGCDPESCKNVLIENCFFSTGDDCIAIKSGRNSDGRKWNIPSENIIVRHCEMKNGHGGVVIGSEISGGFRNLFVEDCTMDSPNLDRVIRIKTSPCRGGVIEKVYVRNVKVGQCKEAVLKINLLYENKENCRHDFPPIVRSVYLQNVTCQKSRYGVMIVGLNDTEHVYDIHLKDCSFNGVQQGNSINGAKDVFFDNLKINGTLVQTAVAKP